MKGGRKEGNDKNLHDKSTILRLGLRLTIEAKLEAVSYTKKKGKKGDKPE